LLAVTSTPRHILVFTRDEHVLLDLNQHLAATHTLHPCDALETLPALVKQHSFEAVLVYLGPNSLGSHSPARFVAELDDLIETAPLYGLFAADCPPRLRKLATRAMQDCLDVPLEYERIAQLLTARQNVESELAGLWTERPHKELHGKTRSLVTFTPAMFGVMEEIKVAARHNVTVLLIGETGCGKTFLARLVHELSDRASERFCTVACGALPPDLIESELFGYVKGAFTGADKDKEGKFAATGRGTLLLDEIDVLPLEQQAKLLRVIETGEFEPVGSNETQRSQARLVVASNYNLEDLVRAGTFRTDLYYRLNILNFRLLPLRERPWDIEYLARKFALSHSRAHGIQLRAIEPAFLDTLRTYHWPGNVREMENVIRRAVLYCQRGVLTVQDLPSAIRAAAGAIPPDASLTDFGPTRSTEFHHDASLPATMGARLGLGPFHTQNTLSAHASYRSPAFGQPQSTPGFVRTTPAFSAALADPSPASSSLESRVDHLERRIIEDCLARNHHRRKETAAELGISRVTLYNKMKKFGLM
jgi:DNA-binding NtrC family response regulator